MNNNKLDQAFDIEDFRRTGHRLVDLLSDQLLSLNGQTNSKVIPYRHPEDELAFWQNDFLESQAFSKDPVDLYEMVLDHSIKVHHRRYMGHQVSVPALTGALSGLVVDLLSNGTGVYEMGMASNAMEKVVTDFLAAKIGFDKSASGFMTSGGTLANLTAMLAARKAKAPVPVWEKGHSGKLAIMASEQAHYCIDRASRIMGLGEKGIIKIPVDGKFRIRTDLLDPAYARAVQDGFTIIAVVGCSCSTATGSFDNLNALADFSQKQDLWFHVDGAHGGPVVFSKKHKHLVAGIERADSVVVDFHKMMLTPSLNTALIFRNGNESYKTFEQNARYLWDAQKSPEWYHTGKRTFECTKLMMSLKIYSLLRTYGEGLFEENVDRLFKLAKDFAKMIRSEKNLELALEPEANIVNFRVVNSNNDSANELNAAIRKAIIEDGKFFIVQTMIRDRRYLRVTIMNPFTTVQDFGALIEEIQKIAASL